MRKVSNALYLLASFSFKGKFYEKALVYAQSGYALFPSDIRFLELYALALMYKNRFEDASSVLVNAPQETRNVALLKCRLAILSQEPKEKCAGLIRQYLKNYY